MAAIDELKAAAATVGMNVEILDTDCDGNPGESFLLDCEDYPQYPLTPEGISNAMEDIAQVQSINAMYDEGKIC